jgi:hypothetical protein
LTRYDIDGVYFDAWKVHRFPHRCLLLLGLSGWLQRRPDAALPTDAVTPRAEIINITTGAEY